MRILIITQWFNPEPTFKGMLFARQLSAQGHTVEVITGFPNYPDGKIYDGYKQKLLHREQTDNITVNRVPLYPSHNTSKIGRVLNYLTFAFSALLCGLLRVKKPDVVYVYHPPLTTSLAAIIISKIRKVPVVCDIQDLWPDTLKATGMLQNEFILNLIKKACDISYKLCDRIVVLSPGFKSRLISRGVPHTKIDVIFNWCDESALLNATPSNLTLPKGFNVVFAGNLGKAQKLESVIEAAAILQKEAIPANITFIGNGLEKPELQNIVKSKSLNNVAFLPQVPMSEIGSVLQQADALLVHLKKDDLFTITIPSKTQAYLSIGKPLIMAVEGDASDLLKQTHNAVCEPENPAALALAVKDISTQPRPTLVAMGEENKKLYKSKFSIDVGCAKFIDIFESLSNRSLGTKDT